MKIELTQVAAPTSPAPTDKVPSALAGVPAEIAAALESGGSLHPLLSRGMGAIIALTGARAGTIRLVLRNDGHMSLVCASGLSPEVLDQEREVEIGCGLCGEALRSDSLRLTTAPAACLRRMGQALQSTGLGPMLAVPLHCRGRAIGVFNLFFDERTALPADLSAILTPVTELLDLVLEGTQHEHERLQASLMAERQSFASEVHDALAQNLSYMRMRMSLLHDVIHEPDPSRAMKYFTDVNDVLGETHAGLRELITHFRQAGDPLGLLHALETTARTFEDRTGIALRIDNRIPDLRLPGEHETQILHIVQEALANVIKHAGARHASIVIERRPEGYRISVADDGRGAADGRRRALRQGGHYGLSIMRERAQRIGARLQIRSRTGKGTSVRLDIPVPGRVPP
ncbi:MAG: GAF domain-containing protein [Betaproteobacteria bacterium]|nr:GAF domain-containing protein [Betaproteobacteria bacterium]